MKEKRINDFIRSYGFQMVHFSRKGAHIWARGPRWECYSQKNVLRLIDIYEEKRQRRNDAQGNDNPQN